MGTYKEQVAKRMSYVLLKANIVLGTFGNLRKLTEFVEDEEFPSYWTIIREREFPLTYNEYSIHKVKHH